MKTEENWSIRLGARIRSKKMNKKKVKKVVENILCVLGTIPFIVGIVAYVILETNYKYKEVEVEEEYSGKYPTYINEIDDSEIAESDYYTSLEEALANAEIYYDEYETYQKTIDYTIMSFENENYISIYYQSYDGKEEICNTFAKFKVKEKDGNKEYAFVESYPFVIQKDNTKKTAFDTIESQLSISDYRQGINIEAENTKFVWGNTKESSLEKSQKMKTFQVEGQYPDGIVEYEAFGETWYFWYFNDLSSDKEGYELEYTF